ncbi:MAG: hypothetical protein ACTSXP_11025 [Promethearchaeota archaeon]
MLKDKPDSHVKEIYRIGNECVEMIHQLARKIWNSWTPRDLQQKCQEKWDRLSSSLGVHIEPLIPVEEGADATNLIFGSGSFSTGRFQVEQFKKVSIYTDRPPVVLQAIVANRSVEHGCNGARISDEFGVPLVELDFIDWYHENVDEKEENPIRATRYWFSTNDPNSPAQAEIENRFKIRQELFHVELGKKISEVINEPTSIVSARGYNFQFCSGTFRYQEVLPHVNDTHPADLTYVDPGTGERLYPGWQSGAVRLMMNDGHEEFRGSLIEVNFMDDIKQIYELDEGGLLAIGRGIRAKDFGLSTAKEIQEAMKIIDDRVFCTIEPTGLILCWGKTKEPVKIAYQDLEGNEVIVERMAIVVGGEIRGGINAWGRDLNADLQNLHDFIFD